MHVDFDAQGMSWRLTWNDILLRVKLQDGALLADYFGPEDRASEGYQDRVFADALLSTRVEASVLLAPDARSVVWEFADWSQPDDERCELVLQANDSSLQAILSFEVDSATGVLRRRTLLRHIGVGADVEISHAGSLAVILPAAIDTVTHLAGTWGAETQVQRLLLPHVPLLLESRSGKTGFEFAPYVALQSSEYTYLAEILWSGNWQLHVYRLGDGQVAVTGGLNDWGLWHRLRPGSQLVLPDALLVCVRGDLNAATQLLHTYQRKQRPDAERPVPVQFNSWYPYQGEPPVEKMKSFAAAAAELGCEVFMQDAGWYTTEHEDPNENWWTRTGDWVVNPRLFPNGLEELSDFCHAQGLGFGIWFEPEAISPSAVVRREHPEWLHAIGGRATPADQRAILHLGVPEAREFIRERILRVLRSTGATWMKWDFNTNLLQGGWSPGLPEALTDQDPLVAHYRGLYQLQDELRSALPDLTLEMCAGGGGRFDAEILAHGHTNWMSDQSQALINLAIHFGSQLAHPAVECNDWLIEWPPHDGLLRGGPFDERGDVAFRTRVAMLGTFGISAPVDLWSQEDRETVKQHVDWYKQIVRPIVHNGDQYLLTDAPPSDGNGDWAACWYVNQAGTSGVLFAFRLASNDAVRTFALPGLAQDATFRIRSLEGASSEYTGAELASGFSITTDAPFQSALIAIERIEA